jgi:nucleoside-diphosphate-sugar epimerase
LVTGGAGFIGSHLVERLAQQGCRVRVFDSLRRNALASTGLGDHPLVELRRADVLDRDAVQAAVAGCDAIVHLASIAGVDTVLRSPVDTMRIALLGTAHFLEAAVAAGSVTRFIDFSTSEVFGRFAYHVTEWDATSLGEVGEARWTYAVAKLASEHLAFSYHKQMGLPAVSIRPFNIYGPRQIGEGAVHHFIVRALKGLPLQVHNEGSQIRAWCYVDDIVDAVLLALVRQEAVGHAFNIGSPRSTLTIFHLAREIIRLAGSTSKIEHVEWKHADVELRVPSVIKARDKLGWGARVDIEEGLLRTIDWYRRQLAAAAGDGAPNGPTRG